MHRRRYAHDPHQPFGPWLAAGRQTQMGPLAWAKEEGQQVDLKRRLALNFADQCVAGHYDALDAAAEGAALDRPSARTVLESGRYAAQVRAEEAFWQPRNRQPPAVVVDNRYLISGDDLLTGSNVNCTPIALQADGLTNQGGWRLT